MRLSTALLISLIISFHLYGQCNLKNNTFAAGEKLKYTVYYNLQFIWLEMADIEFTTSKFNYLGQNCIKLSSTWKTRPKYNWIMHVEDKYEAIIHKDSIVAYEYNQKIVEGKYVSNARYIYHHPENMIYVWLDNKDKGKKFDSIPVNNCIFDLLTSIYYIRNIHYPSYKTNQKIPYSAVLSDKIHKLEIKYAGIETIEIKDDKKYNCHKIKPSIAETEMFKGGNDKLTVWFSVDKNQLPLMAEAELFLGSVKLILKTYEGLRYPLL